MLGGNLAPSRHFIGAEEDCFDKVRDLYPACLPGRSLFWASAICAARCAVSTASWKRPFCGGVRRPGSAGKQALPPPASRSACFARLERSGAVAQRRIRTSRQQPGEIVERCHEIRRDFQRRFILRNRFAEPALTQDARQPSAACASTPSRSPIPAKVRARSDRSDSAPMPAAGALAPRRRARARASSVHSRCSCRETMAPVAARP